MAAALGLLIGLERERNPSAKAGLRTFALTGLFGVLAAAWLSDWLGSRGLYAVALVSGLTDVDAITLSSLRLHNLDKLSAGAAVNVITLVILANLVFKSLLTLAIGGWHMARHAMAGMGALGLGLVAAWAIIHGFSA